jgi:Rieske Fe-S protein
MIDTKSIPKPGERWMSCPPYLLIAHVICVDETAELPVVSYELQDEEGFLLERVEHALLDEGWWRTFQPMIRRSG